MVSPRDGLARVADDFEVEYPGSDALGSEAFVNLFRVGDRIGSELSRRLRADAGISVTAMMVLATIDGLGGHATPSEITDHVPITSAAITSLVDTNERKGLVERQPDAEDRRKVQIVLTDDGRDLIDRVLPAIHRLETDVMTVLTDREKKSLLNLLAKVDRALADAEKEEPRLVAAPRNRPERLGPRREAG